MDIIQVITDELKVQKWQVEAAVKLIDEGCTIPFISRYRKEATGSLNDEQLRTLHERLLYLRNLEDKKNQVIGSIEEQGKLTPELKKQIDEFRVAVFHMNNDDTQGDLYDITDEVENRYEKLRKVPEVNAYLEAELDVCRMLQQVQEQFRNGIDLNIPNV